MVNPDESTLEQKIKELEQWANLINGRIDDISVPPEVRLDIRQQHNIEDLRANIRAWSSAYEQNTQIIDANERFDNDAPEHERQAAVAQLENIENLIVLFNAEHVDKIDQILNQHIHGGRRRVRKRGQESRRRSSARRSSAKKRASRRKPRSTKKRATRRYRRRRA